MTLNKEAARHIKKKKQQKKKNGRQTHSSKRNTKSGTFAKIKLKKNRKDFKANQKKSEKILY